MISRCIVRQVVVIAGSSESRKKWKEAQLAGRLRRLRADMVRGACGAKGTARRALAAELRDVSELACRLVETLESAAAAAEVYATIDDSSSDSDGDF